MSCCFHIGLVSMPTSELGYRFALGLRSVAHLLPSQSTPQSLRASIRTTQLTPFCQQILLHAPASPIASSHHVRSRGRVTSAGSAWIVHLRRQGGFFTHHLASPEPHPADFAQDDGRSSRTCSARHRLAGEALRLGVAARDNNTFQSEGSQCSHSYTIRYTVRGLRSLPSRSCRDSER